MKAGEHQSIIIILPDAGRLVVKIPKDRWMDQDVS